MIRVRSGYSFRRAVGALDDLMKIIKADGWSHAPLTDTASSYGWMKWHKLCLENNIKPVFGVELAVSPDILEKRPVYDYWIFYPRGGDLSVMNDLIALATEQFRYQPLLTIQQALETPCWSIIGRQTPIDKLPPKLPPETFAALAPSISAGYHRALTERGVRWVAASDNQYPDPDDQGLYEVICGRNAETNTWPQYLMPNKEWREWALTLTNQDEVGLSIENTRIVLDDASKAEIGKSRLVTPHIKNMTLRQMCIEGAERRGIDLTTEPYKSRLEKELSFIQAKDFEDYFHIVADIVNWARARMIVGPARGSSCGSLVCYLTGITSIDPIPYGLIFERFIDVNRDNLPDIDVDFSDQHRDEVIDYIRDVYGSHKASRLGTVNLYRPRSALNEVGGAFNIPRWKIEKTLTALIERSGGDARAQDTLEDTMAAIPVARELVTEYPELKVAYRMEGMPRHSGQHACAVILSDTELNTIAPIDKKNKVLMLDKKDAEYVNLLKVDILGLTQLSILEQALEMAGLPRDTLDDLPLDDIQALKVLGEKRATGIFQLSGISAEGLLKQFTLDSFDDIINLTALARPGPLASGASHTWINRRVGKEPVSYPHEIFEPYTRDTAGVVIYQEQVMQIGRECGNLTWAQVSELRGAMSKSLGAEYFNKFGDPWKEGVISKGVPKKTADKVWDDLCKYGSWSFNKSHAVAYALITYWCCWLKAHHPLEFAAATLNFENNPVNQVKLLRELTREGYQYVPIDPDHSGLNWEVHGDKLIGPLTNIKGIGPKIANGVINRRANNQPLPDSVRKKLANPKTLIDSLYPITDAVKRLCPDLTEKNIFSKPMEIKDLGRQVEGHEVLIIATPTRINPKDQNEAVRVAKRGYVITDRETQYLNITMADDTDFILGQISPDKFNQLAVPMIDRGRVGKAIYALKGKMTYFGELRSFKISAVRYLGDLES